MLSWIDALFGDAPWIPALLWVITIAVVIGFGIRTLYRWWPAISRFVATIDSLGKLPEFIHETTVTLAEQNATLSTIKHELFPNSGKSLRDAVNRQAADVNEIKQKLANDNIRISDLQARDEQGRFTPKEQQQ